MNVFDQLPGGAELCNWYGGVPSFHDAEIIELRLHRTEPSSLRIRTWKMTGNVDDEGMFVIEKRMVVAFILEEITDLELSGFNQQNVIDGLFVSQNSAGFQLVLEHIWGLSGSITAQRIKIEFEPALALEN